MKTPKTSSRRGWKLKAGNAAQRAEEKTQSGNNFFAWSMDFQTVIETS